MQSYSSYLSKQITPQTQPLFGRPDQVENSAGGFVFKLDKWDVLHRFLILGCEGGTYYAKEQKLTLENANNILECVKEDTKRAVDMIVAISHEGRAPKNDPAIFALALAATFGKDRTFAYRAVPAVCRIGTHLFQFCQCIQDFGKWGRGLRRAVAYFYTAKEAEALEYQLLKYKQRKGFSHMDVLRLCHAKADSPEVNDLLRIAVGKEPKLVWPAKTAAIRAMNEGNAVETIMAHKLTREMVPTELLARKDIWDALLHSMPINAVIRSLGKLGAVGILDSNFSAASKYIVDLFHNAKALKRARIHPVGLLNALRVYSRGKGEKGKLEWPVCTNVVDALDDAFHSAFAFVEPTGKNFCLGVDVSSSMDGSKIAGTALTAREAAACMTMVTARAEKNHEIIFFADRGPMKVAVPPTMRLGDVIKGMKQIIFGATDCAIPIRVAEHNRWPIDCFVIYTDNQTHSGSMHPSVALANYRKAMSRDAKLVVCGFTSTAFTIADPKDPGMIDVVGFDTSVPAMIAEFVR